jgi:hypothetical protein
MKSKTESFSWREDIALVEQLLASSELAPAGSPATAALSRVRTLFEELPCEPKAVPILLHDLRGSVASILMTLAALEQDLKTGQPRTRFEARVASIGRSARKLCGLIDKATPAASTSMDQSSRSASEIP